MINRIEFKFGSGPGKPNLVIETTPITVFVGPNNSGKSKAISEIGFQCTNGMQVNSDVIIKEVNFKEFDQHNAEQIINSMAVNNQPVTGYTDEHIHIRSRGGLEQVHRPSLLQGLLHPNRQPSRRAFSEVYLRRNTLTLNGQNRIELANDQGGGDLQQSPQSSFQHLFRDDALRSRYSNLVRKSLGSYAVLDPTNLGQLRLRLSSSAPPSPEVERGLTSQSIAFHASAQHIQQASDGAKAFTGILAEILAGDPKVLLMDEPEAFLHPALAFNLGLEVANSLAASDKRMFVSTHSPQFLMGCIQSGVPINVVRLTYSNGVATARLLPSAEIIRLMRNPLLRSMGVVSALFYESVVVTEADPDRAFYQEINERLLRSGRGIPNCVFLNAQNKQTIPAILGPLRRLGIPTAAIYDVDFIKDGGGVATRFMETAGIPELAQQGLTTTRAALAKALLEANTQYKVDGGIRVLAEADKAAADDYFDQLDTYGAFVVREGELESWLKPLGIPGHGPTWLVPMFERMGEDPASPSYISPSEDDVWMFVDKVARWLLHPQRKGIPG